MFYKSLYSIFGWFCFVLSSELTNIRSKWLVF